jgi:hypothetical protein
MKAIPLPVCTIAGISAWLCGEAGAAMAGKLYLTDGPAQRLYSIEGGAVGVNVPTPTGQGPLAISGSTIRTLGRSNSIMGSVYTLSGSVTGTTPSYSLSGSPLFLDGTTDGVFNYALDLNSNRIYRFNLDWSSPSLLFPILTQGRRSGITFDPTSNCLWVTGIDGPAMGLLERYTLDGVVTFAINAGTPAAALAFDHVDQTLWLDEVSTGTIKQYSLEGVFLSSITVPALAGSSIDGAEFAIPEPACSVLWLAGLIALSRTRVRESEGP